MFRKFILAGIFLLLLIPLNAQQLFRIGGEFSLKSTSANGKSALVMGKFYFDRNIKKLVYDLSFPDREVWVSLDTVVFHYNNHRLVGRQKTAPFGEFSMYNFALTNQLSTYGLKKPIYEVKDIQRESDMVITTWAPMQKLSKFLGIVKISTKKNHLYGVVVFSPEGKIVRKQFFDKYLNVKGCDFPGEMVDIIINDKGENYQVITYKNLKIDDLSDNDMYDYPVPDL